MNKYDVRFCNCGRVHFLDAKKIDGICMNGDSVLVVCNNCGEFSETWYDENPDGYYVNSRHIRDTELKGDSIGLIIASSGEKIYMRSGSEATAYINGTFIDWETKEGECSDEDRKIVDTNRTIRMIGDETKITELSHYGVKIDWTGTKYKDSYLKGR